MTGKAISGYYHTDELYRKRKKQEGVEEIVVDAIHHRQDLGKTLQITARLLEEYPGERLPQELKRELAEEIAREKVRMESIIAATGIKQLVQEARAARLRELEMEVMR